MESVVPSQSDHIEIGIVKYELGEATEAIGGLIARQHAIFKSLHLLVVISKADTAENIYQLTRGISAVNVQCNGK